MMLEIVTFVAFLAFAALGLWFGSRWKRWQGTLADPLSADASNGVFIGSLTTAPKDDGLPSIITAPDELTRDMRRAGFYHPAAAVEMHSLRVFLTLLALVVMSIFLVILGPEQDQFVKTIIGWGLGLAFAAYALPWLYVRFKARDRVARIQKSIPDAVDMLSMCLSGGLGMTDALGHVSRELFSSHPDLATELEIVRRHTELTGIGVAFQQFAARLDCPEITSFSAIINQSERLGSNINTAIREYADGVRTKLRQTADEQASKAGIKLLFPLVFCLAPAALIVLWGPAALELRNFFKDFRTTDETRSIQSVERAPGDTAPAGRRTGGRS